MSFILFFLVFNVRESKILHENRTMSAEIDSDAKKLGIQFSNSILSYQIIFLLSLSLFY